MDTSAQDQQTSTPAPPVQTAASSVNSPRSRKSLLLFGILGAIVLIILVIGAYLLGMKNATKKPIVYEASPTTKPTVSKDLTANWKTYTNKVYGYSFKIPSNYSAKECQNSSSVVVGTTPQDLECNRGVGGLGVSSTDQKSAEDSITVLKKDFTMKQKSLSINGIKTVQYEGTLVNTSAPLPSHLIWTVLQNGSQYVLFSYDDFDKGAQSTIYSQIVSTFKFSNLKISGDTANWNTYVDKEDHFSVKYPEDWKEYDHGERFFSPKSINSAAISYEINPSGSTALKLIQDEIMNYSWQNKKVSNIILDGVSATRVEGTEKGVKNIAIAFEGKGYVFKLQTLGDYADVFDQMLSTFKFTQ